MNLCPWDEEIVGGREKEVKRNGGRETERKYPIWTLVKIVKEKE